MSLLFHVVFILDVRRTDGNLNLKNEFSEQTLIFIKVPVGSDVNVTSKTIRFFMILVHKIHRKFNTNRL